jgi:hypothetical protein
MKPTRKDFTEKEWKVIARCKTPLQVQLFLNSMPYNAETKGETLRSFRGVIRTGTAHCLEGALSAAVILEQHGYPVQFLDMESKDHLDHVVFLFKDNGRWGTVARSRDPGLHGRKPVFRSVRDIVDSYFDPFIDHTGRITAFGLGTLEELGPYDWRLSNTNVWRVEKYFNEIPHTKFASSDKRFELWHRRYEDFKQKHPTWRPTYFNDKRKWFGGYPKGR